MEKCIIGEMIIGEMIIGEMLMFRTNLGTNQSYLNLCFKQPTYKLSHYRISTAALKVFLNVPSRTSSSLYHAADPISGRRVAAALVLGAAADGAQFRSHRHLHGPRGK